MPTFTEGDVFEIVISIDDETVKVVPMGSKEENDGKTREQTREKLLRFIKEDNDIFNS